MRVDILINRKAGLSRNADLISPVRNAIPHGSLYFHLPESLQESEQELQRILNRGTDCLMICGGDGTLNSILKPLMDRLNANEKVPPISIIPTGTANDLASELKISKKIEIAAKAAYQGTIRNVDVLEISSSHGKSYMITNGGMGIPAETAHQANRAKEWAQRTTPCTLPRLFHPFSKLGKKLVTQVGPKIYEAMLLRELLRWENDDWSVTIEAPDQKPIHTKAPMILVNNQSSIGGHFVPAPKTQNHDGTFNVFLFNPTQILPQLSSILSIKNGIIPSACPSFETSEISFSATSNAKPFTFFGDGEVIHREIREMSIRCIHPGLPILAFG